MPKQFTYSFIGLGLIGGSIAKALRHADPSCIIKAYDIDNTSLSLAHREGTADETTTVLTDSFFDCDILFLCAPVSRNDAMLDTLKGKLHKNTILTDVGSVKQTTHHAIEEAGLGAQFIGGHPMAGSEKTGFANANPLLLENAYYILTPTSQVAPEKTEQMKNLIHSIGAIPLVLSYEKHDYITAAVSHLPHIISACLVNLVKHADDEEGRMKQIAAGGFKDITRISSSSPVMWESICMTNTDNILKLLSDYIDDLSAVRHQLEMRSSDDLYALFDTAKEYRDSFTNAEHGPIKKIHSVFVDIPDIPGSLARTAVILAEHNLSIKNIGIMHSREFQQGALRIEFYDEQTVADAAKVLRENHYTIYEN